MVGGVRKAWQRSSDEWTRGGREVNKGLMFKYVCTTLESTFVTAKANFDHTNIWSSDRQWSAANWQPSALLPVGPFPPICIVSTWHCSHDNCALSFSLFHCFSASMCLWTRNENGWGVQEWCYVSLWLDASTDRKSLGNLRKYDMKWCQVDILWYQVMSGIHYDINWCQVDALWCQMMSGHTITWHHNVYTVP